MNPYAITLIAAAVLLLASSTSGRANVEAGGGGFAIDLGNLTDSAETLYNVATEQRAVVDMDTAQTNIAAFLAMIRHAEGTAASGDPYGVCYGYRHTISNFADHPRNTGEWNGERLSDAMCKNAGFGPGCVSTAAGAYQIIRPTWNTIKARLGLPDFGPQSQDAAAVQLIANRGALEDVKAGRVAAAINKCRNEWASLPGNYAKQGQRSQGALVAWYQQNGGMLA
jgi:lysozyme